MLFCSWIATAPAAPRDDGKAGSLGYTFPLMLVILAALAFAASRIELAESYRLRRDKEEELLFRGQAYIQAIQAYQQKNQQYPRRLDDLASDAPGKRRYIRQLYKDPMTGRDFTPVLTPEGTVIGVVSSSMGAPFRKADFEKELEGFDKAKTYADWKFKAKPGADAGTGQPTSAALPLVRLGPH